MPFNFNIYKRFVKGFYGFPQEEAARIALEETLKWLEKKNLHKIDRIVFCTRENATHEAYKNIILDQIGKETLS